MDYQNILSSQREFFNTQKTKNIKFRKIYLEKLRDLIIQNENYLYEAIYKDFGKSPFETYVTEISFILKDIDYYLKNLNRLSKPKKVTTNLANQFATSRIHSEPLGCTLVIGAWNYPYQLSLSPLIASIAAGNCCILKPSEIAEHTMKAMPKSLMKISLQNTFMFLRAELKKQQKFSSSDLIKYFSREAQRWVK